MICDCFDCVVFILSLFLSHVFHCCCCFVFLTAIVKLYAVVVVGAIPCQYIYFHLIVHEALFNERVIYRVIFRNDDKSTIVCFVVVVVACMFRCIRTGSSFEQTCFHFH